MKAERWRHIEEVFHSALRLSDAERDVYLEESCAEDQELLLEVRALLAALDSPHALLNLDSPSAGHPFIVAEDAVQPTDLHFGPYRALKEIGMGGMSRVYLAQRDDKEFERLVAVKVIRRDLGQYPIRDRFHLEEQILARLEHPDIARLYDGGTTAEGLPYLVMEYVKGERLDVHCQRKKPTLDRRLRIFQRICGAVAYAHGALVIHRDIKPSNILVTGTGEPKLLDFGIAKLLAVEEPQPTADSTRPSIRLMTPGYASPEQIQGRPMTTTSDIYSLGVVLYEMLTGSLPLTPEVISGMVLGAEAPEPVAPSVMVATQEGDFGVSRRQLAGDLDSIVMKALAWESERRYASVNALAADLERYLRGRPVRARRANFFYRANKLMRRNRLVSSVAAALLVMTLTAILLLGLLAAQLARQRALVQSESDRAKDIASFLTEMFRVTDESGGKISARQVLGRGAERIAAELSLDSTHRADLLETLGKAYSNLGIFDQAFPLFAQALEIREADLGKEHPALASALYQSGFLKVETGEYAEAGIFLRRALAIQEKSEDTLGVGLTLGQLAWIVGTVGDLEGARQLQQEGLVLLRQQGEEQERYVAAALNRLGIFSGQQHKQDEAEAYFREAVEIDRRLPGPKRMTSVMFLRNLAATLAEKGELEEARNMHHESLQVSRRLFGEDHPAVAGAYQKLASLHHRAGEHREAEELFLKALEMRRRLLGAGHPRVGWTLQALAALNRDLGRVEKAIAYYRESMQIFAIALPESHLRASPMAGLGGLYLDQGQTKKAEPLLRDSLTLLRKTQPAESPLLRQTEERLEHCKSLLAGAG